MAIFFGNSALCEAHRGYAMKSYKCWRAFMRLTAACHRSSPRVNPRACTRMNTHAVIHIAAAVDTVRPHMRACVCVTAHTRTRLCADGRQRHEAHQRGARITHIPITNSPRPAGRYLFARQRHCAHIIHKHTCSIRAEYFICVLVPFK